MTLIPGYMGTCTPKPPRSVPVTHCLHGCHGCLAAGHPGHPGRPAVLSNKVWVSGQCGGGSPPRTDVSMCLSLLF